MKLLDDYHKALNKIYNHVGYQEGWVTAPIDDCTNMYWSYTKDEVMFAKTKNELIQQDGDYYVDEIYYSSSSNGIYKGKKFTMIFSDPHTDGMLWLKIFNNKYFVDVN